MLSKIGHYIVCIKGVGNIGHYVLCVKVAGSIWYYVWHVNMVGNTRHYDMYIQIVNNTYHYTLCIKVVDAHYIYRANTSTTVHIPLVLNKFKYVTKYLNYIKRWRPVEMELYLFNRLFLICC